MTIYKVLWKVALYVLQDKVGEMFSLPRTLPDYQDLWLKTKSNPIQFLVLARPFGLLSVAYEIPEGIIKKLYRFIMCRILLTLW